MLIIYNAPISFSVTNNNKENNNNHTTNTMGFIWPINKK